VTATVMFGEVIYCDEMSSWVLQGLCNCMMYVRLFPVSVGPTANGICYPQRE